MTTLGYKHTEETKRKIGKAHEGKRLSEEHKNNISKATQREKSGSWNNGLRQHNGYIQFLVPKGCRFSSMKNSCGYVPLHRLIMAAHLGRPLTKEEVVHHINGDITDNRKENLRLFKNVGRHMAYHHKLRRGKC